MAADVFPADKEAADLIRQYKRAQLTIANQVRLALATGNLQLAEQRRQQLATVLSLLDSLGVPLEQSARQVVRNIFVQATDLTAQRLARLGIPVITPASFVGVNAEAITVMQDAIVNQLSEARRTVGRQIDDVFARAGRRSVLQGLLGASGSRRAASSELTQQLQARGVTAFTDRAGRAWKLADYAEMAVRTTTRETVVEAAKLRMAASGVDLARVTTHASACPTCKPWEGKLVSLDGGTSDLDGEPVATLDAMPNNGPPFHPRCRHSLAPVVPDLERLLRAA